MSWNLEAIAQLAGLCRVKVGGGRWVAVKELALQPTLWALLGGLALAVLQMPLPEAVSERVHLVRIACCRLAGRADKCV